MQTLPPKALALLCKRYQKKPSWWGLFVLAFAQRTEVEALYSFYQFMASPSEVLELLGEGAKDGNPVQGARGLLRTRWRGLAREHDREAVAAYLAASPSSIADQIDAQTLLEFLTEEELLLVNLLYLEDMTQAEASEVSGMAERTIRERLLAIKKKLERFYL